MKIIDGKTTRIYKLKQFIIIFKQFDTSKIIYFLFFSPSNFIIIRLLYFFNLTFLF